MRDAHVTATYVIDPKEASIAGILREFCVGATDAVVITSGCMYLRAQCV